MLRDRYPIDKVFEDVILLVPKMDPVLAKIDRCMEDEALFKLVRDDLAKRRPKTLQTGRNSTPVEVVLRMLGVRRLYGYSYEQTERQVSDSLVLRQFCWVYLNRVPDDTVLIKYATVFDSDVSGTYQETAEGKTHSFPVRNVRDYLNGSTANPATTGWKSRCGARLMWRMWAATSSGRAALPRW